VQQPTIDASRSATRVSVSFAFSVALHVSLLAFAMMGTTKEARLTTPAREVGEHLEYAFVLPSPDQPAPPPEVAPRVAPKRRGVPPVVLPEMKEDLPFSTDLVIPKPQIPDVPIAVLVDTIFPGEVSGQNAPNLEPAGVPSGVSTASDAGGEPTPSAYDIDAIPLPENPKPVYPPTALRRNIEQAFAVEFVVDTTGRVDASSIIIPPSVPREFAESVRHAVVRWHFRPAQLRGLSVRRSVRQPFIFQIAGPNT
jgi:TonB family protein